jgi:CheY-like chemotaxis protein
MSKNGHGDVHDLSPVARPLRVLIVDGNTAIRRTLREALEGARYQVSEATDGADALTILGLLQERVVALLGADLPDMDIGDVLTAIRTLPHLQAAGHGYLLMADTTSATSLAAYRAAQVLHMPIVARPPHVQELLHNLARAVVRMVTSAPASSPDSPSA